MSRLVLLLAIACALSSCTVLPDRDEGDDGPDAQSVKAEMDAEAQALLPDLVEGTGGRLASMKAAFYERGGFGIWDYEASGQLTEPPGTMDQTLDSAQAVLDSHGYDTERDPAQKRVSGRKGNVSVIVQAALLSDDATVSALQLRMGIIDPVGEGDDFAEATPPEDYLAYLE